MNVKFLVCFVLIVIVVVTILVAQKTWVRIESDTLARKSERHDLPVFDLDSLIFNARKFRRDVLVIFFDPDCPECVSQGHLVSKNLNGLKDYEIVWVSDMPESKITSFSETCQLASQPQVSFYTIDDREVLRAFGSPLTPHLFIYGPDGNLLKEFKGQTQIEEILK
jgi:hypothetical protein